jgi:hypothetical protein
VSDLLESPEREVRHRVLDFLCHLVIGQYAALDIMRAQFFRFLKQHKDKVRHFVSHFCWRRVIKCLPLKNDLTKMFGIVR